jgi:hypothetical protein
MPDRNPLAAGDPDDPNRRSPGGFTRNQTAILAELTGQGFRHQAFEQEGAPSRASVARAQAQGGILQGLTLGRAGEFDVPEDYQSLAGTVAGGAGMLAGSIPLAMVTGGLVTAGLSRAAIGSGAVAAQGSTQAARLGVAAGQASRAGDAARAAQLSADAARTAATAQRAGKASAAFQYLATRPVAEATRVQRMLQGASQNVVQGLGFSAVAGPLWELEEGESRAERIALEFGVGAAADFLLGSLFGLRRAHIPELVNRMRNSDNDLHRDIGRELAARAGDMDPVTEALGPGTGPEGTTFTGGPGGVAPGTATPRGPGPEAGPFTTTEGGRTAGPGQPIDRELAPGGPVPLPRARGLGSGQPLGPEAGPFTVSEGARVAGPGQTLGRELPGPDQTGGPRLRSGEVADPRVMESAGTPASGPAILRGRPEAPGSIGGGVGDAPTPRPPGRPPTPRELGDAEMAYTDLRQDWVFAMQEFTRLRQAGASADEIRAARDTATRLYHQVRDVAEHWGASPEQAARRTETLHEMVWPNRNLPDVESTPLPSRWSGEGPPPPTAGFRPDPAAAPPVRPGRSPLAPEPTPAPAEAAPTPRGAETLRAPEAPTAPASPLDEIRTRTQAEVKSLPPTVRSVVQDVLDATTKQEGFAAASNLAALKMSREQSEVAGRIIREALEALPEPTPARGARAGVETPAPRPRAPAPPAARQTPVESPAAPAAPATPARPSGPVRNALEGRQPAPATPTPAAGGELRPGAITNLERRGRALTEVARELGEIRAQAGEARAAMFLRDNAKKIEDARRSLTKFVESAKTPALRKAAEDWISKNIPDVSPTPGERVALNEMAGRPAQPTADAPPARATPAREEPAPRPREPEAPPEPTPAQREVPQAREGSPGALAAAAPEGRAPIGRPMGGLKGRETTAIFPGNDQRVRVQYRLVPADDIVPSHNPTTFGRNPDAVREAQMRSREADKLAQENVVKLESRLDDRWVDTGQPVDAGMPTVRSDGQVIAGHGRSMAALRAAQREGPGYRKIRDAVIARADEFGLSREEVEAAFGEKPHLLVREIVGDAGDLEATATLRDLNVSSDRSATATKDAIDEAASRASIMQRSRDSLEHFQNTVADDQSVRAYLDTADGNQFMRKLVDDGVITEAERSAFMQSSGEATAAGKDLVEAMLRIAALGDADVVRASSKAIIRKLDTSIPSIIRSNAVGGDWGMGERVVGALRVLNEFNAFRNDPNQSARNLSHWLEQRGQQGNLLDSPRKIPADDLTMARFIGEDANTKELRNAMEIWAREAEMAGKLKDQEDIFGFTPAEAKDIWSRVFKAHDRIRESKVDPCP